MNPLVAKRKIKSSFNIEKDYFIFGIYPSNPSFLINFLANANDHSKYSFNIKNEPQHQIIISCFQNTNCQLVLLLFAHDDEGKPKFIFQSDDPSLNNDLKEKYMKQVIHIKPMPKIDSGDQALKIDNLKLSSFSYKNEILVLTECQYQLGLSMLTNASEKKYGKISVFINKSNFQDIVFIPAVISHLHLRNQFEGPFLIVARTENTVDILFQLFNQWSLLKTLVMLGNDEELNILQKYAFPLVPTKLDVVQYHVVLTTQLIFNNTQDFFNSLTWNFIVILDNSRVNLLKMQSCAHFGINIEGVRE